MQDEVADDVLRMLRDAMRELAVGNPARLATDVGPVISAAARERIERHIVTMRARGHRVTTADLPPEAAKGWFVAPTIIEIDRIGAVEQEVFGPVLHVLRYQRADLDRVIAAINATGYALTFGLHTRIDETITGTSGKIAAGNIYINRNMIGASVGVQPFGGSGLSGTGPKAGGPLYLSRLVTVAQPVLPDAGRVSAAAEALIQWLEITGRAEAAAVCADFAAQSLLGLEITLPGPVGERNVYRLRPRGRIGAVATSPERLLTQLGAILATGNIALVDDGDPAALVLRDLPHPVATCVERVASSHEDADLKGVLFDGDETTLQRLNQRIARRDGPIVPVLTAGAGPAAYELHRLLDEQSVSTNTAAAGGNASLMTLGD